jgi:hypothetical protein
VSASIPRRLRQPATLGNSVFAFAPETGLGGDEAIGFPVRLWMLLNKDIVKARTNNIVAKVLAPAAVLGLVAAPPA